MSVLAVDGDCQCTGIVAGGGAGRGVGGPGMETRAVVADRGRTQSPPSVYSREPGCGTRTGSPDGTASAFHSLGQPVFGLDALM